MLETASPDLATAPSPSSDSDLDDLSLPSRDYSLSPPPETKRDAAGLENGLRNGVHEDKQNDTKLTTISAGGEAVIKQGSPLLNGDHGDDIDGDRPLKRRRTRDSTPPPNDLRKIKPESPPWKRVAAEGPTSFMEGGRRKSGRVNTLPLELQPSDGKRKTRGVRNVSQSSPPNAAQQAASTRPNRLSNGVHKSHSTPKSTSKQTPVRTKPTPSSVSKPSSQKQSKEPRSNPRPARRRSPSPPPRQGTRHSTRARRPAHGEGTDGVPMYPTRSRAEWSDEIPLVHADQVRKRVRIGTSFEDFWQRAADIAVEEGGLQASEDGPVYTSEMAARDAQVITRIEEAVEDGGILSRSRCSLYAPEAEEEPPRQYARLDHMTRAMTNFRRLMVAEQQRHRATAKKLAEACRDEWIRRQPKSDEQIEAEARTEWIARYRFVVRIMHLTWENVKIKVNRERLAEWHAEEQRRVKAALNEAVNLSEQRLQARQAGLDSEQLSEEDGFDDLSDDMMGSDEDMGESNLESDDDSSGEGGDSEDSEVMSSSDEDEDENPDDTKETNDEGLTQEELRAKYADMPAMEDATELADPSQLESDDGSSDESVDMDDDMGSSADDSDGDETNEASDSDDGSDADEGGLLGLFFNKSELKNMKTEQDQTSLPPNIEDVDMVDAVIPPASNGAEAEDVEMKVDHLNDHESGDDQAMTNGTSAEADIVMSGAIQSVPTTNGHVTVEESTSNHEERIVSPETEAVMTNPPSLARSQSPLTSETKPSEVDESTNGETALVKAVQEVAGTPKSPSEARHKTEIPFLLRGTLREYQHDGLDWLAGLYANNTNGILADEMGLGKTIQTIALLAHLACQHEVWGPHLVVVPTSVMLNWEMEFKKWCPGFKILAYYGNQDERKRKRAGWNNDDKWNVCITSYQLVLADAQVFRRRKWHYLILDEAHNIKNFKSLRWQTLLGFNTHSRLLLTGTPLQNNLTELWSLLFFLMPAENGVGGFADLQEFHDWFHKPESQILESGREQMDDEARAIISKLHKVLRPYLLRRLKADVEKQMPGKYEHVEFCRLSKRQRELYDGFLARSDTKDTLNSGNYLSIINCLMQLRKVCNHPDLFVDRPIMTSFRMWKSVASEYEVIDQTLQRSMLREKPMSSVSLGFLNLVPTQHEHISSVTAERISQLGSHRALVDLREIQRQRAQKASATLDPSTVKSTIAYLDSASRWGRFEELQHSVYLNALRRQQKPIYGKNLIDLVTVGSDKRPFRPRPKVPQRVMRWFEEDSAFLHALTPSIEQRADSFKTTIEKFSCVTPAVVTRDISTVVLGRQGINAFTDEDMKLSAPVRWAPFMPKQSPPDPWHEARMRLSIQFPDKRLLQYDCGKLQILDQLLRKLQAGGHRALIFTQMTKVLDILEQFLNIHGHKYLRLDGATKVEQRQILTDRFNNDDRILCFILSTRSGGLGINLTGADTVIFYDQDWNPAMDKQCQDRCHRIGQTRDVHIYRLVSEHTIEANILRKASQKQMLDDVVIQEGEFTTDRFKQRSVGDVLSEKVDFTSEGVSAADAALDRVLGVPGGSGEPTSGNQRTVGRRLEQAEDREDVQAARAAEKEILADDADFTEKPNATPSGTSSARQGTPLDRSVLDGGLDDVMLEEEEEAVVEKNADGEKMGDIDQYMLRIMFEQLKHTKLDIPKDNKKGKKKGKDTRKR